MSSVALARTREALNNSWDKNDRERLKEIMEKDAGRDGQAGVHKLDGHREPEHGEENGREARKASVNERLKDVLNKPREKLEIVEEREICA